MSSSGSGPCSLDAVVERLARHVVHGQEAGAVDVARLDHVDQLRVVDLGGGPRLAGEAAGRLVVAHEARLEHLQRHDHPVLVDGAEDDPHSALPELLVDDERAEGVARLQRPRVGLAPQRHGASIGVIGRKSPTGSRREVRLAPENGRTPPDRLLRGTRHRGRGGGDARALRRRQGGAGARDRRRLRRHPGPGLPGRADRPAPVGPVRRPRAGGRLRGRQAPLQGAPPDRRGQLPRGWHPAAAGNRPRRRRHRHPRRRAAEGRVRARAAGPRAPRSPRRPARWRASTSSCPAPPASAARSS